MNYLRYLGGYGAPFDPSEFTGRGKLTIKVLPELIGKPLNHVAMAYISALAPNRLRITTGEKTTDFFPSRVTVVLGDDGTGMVIKDVEMERIVMLPPGIPTANQLRRAL